MSQRQPRSRSAVPNSTNRSAPGPAASRTSQRPPVNVNTRSQSANPPRTQTNNQRSQSANPRTQTNNQRSQSANTRTQSANLRSARSQSANPRSNNTKGNGGSRPPARGNTGNPRARMQFYVRGPGPAGYVLPPLLGKPHHAVTHKIMPAPILGLKCYRDPPRYGPGPAYGIRYGLKANGDYLGLKYTMRPRLDMKPKVKSPGPAIVNLTGKVDLLRPKLPKYTMRIRPPAFNKANYPAPNAYILPPMLGPAVITRPARIECSMKGDRKFKIFSRSPGPVYDIGKVELVKSKAPVYTLRPKHGYFKTNYGPGAAAYMLNKVIYPTRPAWMFGIKHTDFAGILKAKCDKLKMDPSPCNCDPTIFCC